MVSKMRVERGPMVWEVFRAGDYRTQGWLKGWLMARRPGDANHSSYVTRFDTLDEARAAMDADIRAHGYDPAPLANSSP